MPFVCQSVPRGLSNKHGTFSRILSHRGETTDVVVAAVLPATAQTPGVFGGSWCHQAIDQGFWPPASFLRARTSHLAPISKEREAHALPPHMFPKHVPFQPEARPSQEQPQVRDPPAIYTRHRGLSAPPETGPLDGAEFEPWNH